ncbi:MAG: hypothetical protein ACOY4K_09090 [Pseudomonadota bacterium]
MNPLGLWRRSRIEASLAAHRLRHGEAAEGDVGPAQLDGLNAAWRESLRRSPWARALRDRLDLPDRFADWDDFARRVPVQRKADVRLDLAAAAGPAGKVLWRSTGGTTAEPMRFPVFASETRDAALDIWLGRDRLGVTAADPVFMIWGHSHMFGTGLRGAVAQWRRRATDLALGYTRWNAYRLSDADLDQAADALIRSRARYVIGYSTALDRFARVNAGRATALARLGLKVVIATAEAFPRADSREAIAACFGCPVAMEYGAVETGPIAYERPGDGYDVFWRHYRLELAGQGDPGGPGELIVTSLYPRALPLLRYAVGDLATPRDGGVLTRMGAIAGRCNDHVELAGGAVIHSEAFTHVMRDIPEVRSYQIVRRRSAALPTIRVETPGPLAPALVALVRDRLARVDPRLAGVEVEATDRIARSVAGKHRMVVEEP